MSTCEIIVLGILGGFAVLGILIGLLRGAIKGLVRGLIIIGCVAVSVIFNRQITDAVFGINIQGETLESMLMGVISLDGTGIDPNTARDLLWPIVFITSQILICLISMLVLVEVSWIVVLIIDLILKLPLKGKKKFRLLGALFGLISGLLVGLSVDSLFTGLAPNLYKVYKLEIGDTKVSELIEIPEDVITDSGIETFNAESDSFIYKVGSLLNPLVYDRVSVATLVDSEGVERTYTFDGQINSIVRCAGLADTFSKLAEVDFSDSENVDDVISALNQLDFNNLTEEEQHTIDTLIQSVVDMVGVEVGEDIQISTEALAATNFEAVGDIIGVVGNIEDGESVDQDTVTGIFEELLQKKEGSEMNTVDAIASCGVDVSAYSENPDVADVFNASIAELENKKDSNGNNVYSEEELDSLRAMFFGSAA